MEVGTKKYINSVALYSLLDLKCNHKHKLQTFGIHLMVFTSKLDVGITALFIFGRSCFGNQRFPPDAVIMHWQDMRYESRYDLFPNKRIHYVIKSTTVKKKEKKRHDAGTTLDTLDPTHVLQFYGLGLESWIIYSVIHAVLKKKLSSVWKCPRC